ncbi:MAG: hypothetical protein GY861_06945 [bacterium]|nr:hypothetical protein [bacterium]
MVLESLVNPVKAERRPWEMFFVGTAYSSAAVLLSLFIFGVDSSLVMVFLTALAATPLMYGAIKLEEKKDLEFHEEKVLIKEHGRALLFFMFLFTGFVISFALWYTFLPADSTDELFSIQTREIGKVQSAVSGNVVADFNLVNVIFFNNMKVMMFCLIFAFFYGVGAIFILAWNASVIGAAIGGLMRDALGAGQLSNFSLSVIHFAPHGILEILAYFMAGLAGGIISMAIIKHDFNTREYKHILLDSTDLVLGAILVLFFAALVEVWGTPNILAFFAMLLQI